MHLLATATFMIMGMIVAVQGLGTNAGTGWVWRLAHLAIIAVLYVGIWRTRRRYFIIVGMALQAVLIAFFVYNDVPDRDATIYIPTVILSLLVPMQVLFVALRRLERVYPIWASMAIWRMSRNPLQYSWLVLLIVMVTGLGILATTVGGTLDRSYKERVLYEVASDVRVTGIPAYFARGTDALKERYLDIPGISSLSLAMRGEGSVGATYSGNNFDILAVESDEFPYVTWYRDDFSERPLSQVMSLLKTGAGIPPIEVPRGADRIYVWAHPEEDYSNMFLWMVLKDRYGIIDTITFGPMQQDEWTLMESRIPSDLEWPVSLVSVQIYEPAFGPAGNRRNHTPGRHTGLGYRRERTAYSRRFRGIVQVDATGDFDDLKGCYRRNRRQCKEWRKVRHIHFRQRYRPRHSGILPQPHGRAGVGDRKLHFRGTHRNARGKLSNREHIGKAHSGEDNGHCGLFPYAVPGGQRFSHSRPG